MVVRDGKAPSGPLLSLPLSVAGLRRAREVRHVRPVERIADRCPPRGGSPRCSPMLTRPNSHGMHSTHHGGGPASHCRWDGPDMTAADSW
ncbi:hypothetical protein ACFQHO_39870 [Actinomadura yumaensis]|uniref:Uncharacterized protein n=1 Tax=Actinomadura yumaensis TaxID=111807 RepID=A0ABW2CMR0_9ACTN